MGALCCCMRNISVGVFHDDAIGDLIGKKGTCSDIVMWNKKTDDHIFSLMSPVEDKLSAKVQILSQIDVALVAFSGKLSAEFGESLVLLDCFGISVGAFVVPPYTDTSQLESFVEKLSCSSFRIVESDMHQIVSFLESVKPDDCSSDPKTGIVVDHSFSVKGVGEVVLGVVRKGVVSKHQKVVLYPEGRKIVVRSIQMQDVDVDEASCGSRVGLAIKGAKADEMPRGCVLGSDGAVEVAKKLCVSFVSCPFYRGKLKFGSFHLAVGMQVVPIQIVEISNEKLIIEADRDICWFEDDVGILLDLNASKMHVMGSGTLKSC